MKVMLIPLAIAAIFFSTGIQIQYNGSGGSAAECEVAKTAPQDFTIARKIKPASGTRKRPGSGGDPRVRAFVKPCSSDSI
jgi:hypothetical protein